MYEKLKELYSPLIRANSNIVLHEIDGIIIPFDHTWNNIAVNLSGGADSALLTFLLADIIVKNNYKTKIYAITFVRNWERCPWQEDSSKQVFNKIKSMYNDVIESQIFSFIPPELEYARMKKNIIGDQSGDNIITVSFNNYISYRKNIDCIFEATNSISDELNHPEQPAKRKNNITNAKTSNLIFKKEKTLFCSPFRFIFKDWIVKEYSKNKIMDIFEMTRSCEGKISSNKIKNVVNSLENYKIGQHVPVCDECFWCAERKWALNKLAENKND